MVDRNLSTMQASAIIHISKVRGGVSTKIRKVVAEALVRRGYAEWVRLPLVTKPGLRLTAAGKRYAEDGERIA